MADYFAGHKEMFRDAQGYMEVSKQLAIQLNRSNSYLLINPLVLIANFSSREGQLLTTTSKKYW
jgi:hypothetical protein